MFKNHYIYLLFDKNNKERFYSKETNKYSRKIGSTCNMEMRMKPYLTRHPDTVPLECYYKILNPELFTCYEIDTMIKKEFNEYNIKSSGGIEFYEENMVNQMDIEKFFNKINIKFEKIFDIIYDNIITKKDIDDLMYDIEEQKIKYEENKCDLLIEYIEKIKERQIIKELMNFNENIFNCLLEKFNENDIKYLKKNLIDDQIEILLTSVIYYEYNNKSIWNIFCRYGKTRLSSLFCKMKKYKKILIIVPSIYLINQTYETWINYFDKTNVKKICSFENNSELEDIINFYNKNKISIFISTYNSSYKLENIYFDICIFDEAHRTTGSKLNKNTGETTFFKSQLENNNIKNKLFLTATTKEYIGENDDYYSMDDENIYGKIIASVSANKAKELQRICDYNIITIELKPFIVDIDINIFFEKNNVIDNKQKEYLYNIKNKYLMCAIGLYETMEKYNINHVITFHEFIINCKFFKTICKKICNLYNIQNIDGETKNKKEIIDNFQKNNKSILCSAKVLQEGVDIPYCDGVIFIDIKTSIIDTIQSLSRCLTKIDNFPDKVGNIMIPYDDKTDLLNDKYTNNLRLILRNIVEVDENIKEFFKEIQIYDFENNCTENNKILEELKIKYKVNINTSLIKNLREISYETYNNAKKIIFNKYTDENDYKLNVVNDYKNTEIKLPLNANEIYKSFGWNNWNDYLGLENEMTLRKIKLIIQKENENRKKRNIEIIDTKNKYQDFVKKNKNLDLPPEPKIDNNNWIKFLLKNYNELVENHYKINELENIFTNYKISNKIQYEEITLIDNKLIKYEYIINGFYNENNLSINLDKLYFIKKQNTRRF